MRMLLLKTPRRFSLRGASVSDEQNADIRAAILTESSDSISDGAGPHLGIQLGGHEGGPPVFFVL